MALTDGKGEVMAKIGNGGIGLYRNATTFGKSAVDFLSMAVSGFGAKQSAAGIASGINDAAKTYRQWKEIDALKNIRESCRVPRPGDEDFIGPLTSLEHHFIEGDGIGPKKRGVLGAHNMDYFNSTLESTGFPLEQLLIGDPIPHPNIKGIYAQKYRVPAFDGRGNNIGFKAIPDPKTIYDPRVVSNRQMLEWGFEAMQNGVITGRYIRGSASNGLIFRGFIENGKVTNFFPIISE